MTIKRPPGRPLPGLASVELLLDPSAMRTAMSVPRKTAGAQGPPHRHPCHGRRLRSRQRRRFPGDEQAGIMR